MTPHVVAQAVANFANLGAAATVGIVAGITNKPQPILALSVITISSVGDVPEIVESAGSVEVIARTADAGIVLIAIIEIYHKAAAITRNVSVGPIERAVIIAIANSRLSDGGRNEHLINAMDNAVVTNDVRQNYGSSTIDQDVGITGDCDLHTLALDGTVSISIEDVGREHLSSLDGVILDDIQKSSAVEEAVEAIGPVFRKCIKKIFECLIRW